MQATGLGGVNGMPVLMLIVVLRVVSCRLRRSGEVHATIVSLLVAGKSTVVRRQSLARRRERASAGDHRLATNDQRTTTSGKIRERRHALASSQPRSQAFALWRF